MKPLISYFGRILLGVLIACALQLIVTCSVASADDGADILGNNNPDLPDLTIGGGARTAEGMKPDEDIFGATPVPDINTGGASTDRAPCPEYSGLGARFANVAAALGADPCPQPK